MGGGETSTTTSTGPGLNPYVMGLIGMTPLGSRAMRAYGMYYDIQLARERERRIREDQDRQNQERAAFEQEFGTTPGIMVARTHTEQQKRLAEVAQRAREQQEQEGKGQEAVAAAVKPYEIPMWSETRAAGDVVPDRPEPYAAPPAAGPVPPPAPLEYPAPLGATEDPQDPTQWVSPGGARSPRYPPVEAQGPAPEPVPEPAPPQPTGGPEPTRPTPMGQVEKPFADIEANLMRSPYAYTASVRNTLREMSNVRGNRRLDLQERRIADTEAKNAFEATASAAAMDATKGKGHDLTTHEGWRDYIQELYARGAGRLARQAESDPAYRQQVEAARVETVRQADVDRLLKDTEFAKFQRNYPEQASSVLNAPKPGEAWRQNVQQAMRLTAAAERSAAVIAGAMARVAVLVDAGLAARTDTELQREITNHRALLGQLRNDAMALMREGITPQNDPKQAHAQIEYQREILAASLEKLMARQAAGPTLPGGKGAPGKPGAAPPPPVEGQGGQSGGGAGERGGGLTPKQRANKLLGLPLGTE